MNIYYRDKENQNCEEVLMYSHRASIFLTVIRGSHVFNQATADYLVMQMFDTLIDQMPYVSQPRTFLTCGSSLQKFMILQVQWFSEQLSRLFNCICHDACATNRPQELDEAARRRLTKRLYIPLPTAGTSYTVGIS